MSKQRIEDKLAKEVLKEESGLESQLGRDLTYLEMTRVQDDVLMKWIENKKYDDLINYILYQYECDDGFKWWKPVLYDLENIKDIKRIKKLLNGLLPCRLVRFKENLKYAKKEFVGNMANAIEYKYKVLEILNNYFQTMSRLGEQELADMIKKEIISLYKTDRCSLTFLKKDI